LRKRTYSLALAVTLLAVPYLFAQNPPRLGRDDIKKVVAAMTLEEKVRLVVGMGYRGRIPGLPSMSAEDAALPERVPGAAGRTRAIERLGIPSITLADGPAGIRIAPRREGETRTYFATGFPVATAIAASWDTGLAERVGKAFGNEAREYGVDVLLAPGMNIHRNPLGGRNFEYYSEDPLVAGRFAASFVRGVQSEGVGTSIKHFAVNNQEFNRFQSNSIVGERALREIYLRGFEIAVKEGRPWTVMSAYNLINGTFASQNGELLTGILRNDWGFEGIVMTDWFAGNDPAAQMAAGNDLLMPGLSTQEKGIVEAVKEGRLSMKELDANVERVLRLVERSLSAKGAEFNANPDLEGNAMVARQAATEGMVLLENRQETLPIKEGSRIALYGIRSYATIAGGTGSGDVNKAYTVPVDEGLRNAGYVIDAEKTTEYGNYLAETREKLPKPVPFFPNPPIPEMPVGVSTAEEDAAAADIAVVTIGRDSGEFSDLKREADFELSATEKAVIREVSKAFRAQGKRVVVLLNIGAPVETDSWKDLADAILIVWQAGQEGGNAAADVIGGKVNPSGRLAVTFPKAYPDVPSSSTFPGREIPGAKLMIENLIAGKPAEAIYNEGIFVGYRYYSTFGVAPAYPFGYGLSYTEFLLTDAQAGKWDARKGIEVTATVKNTGRASGREVIQLYVSAPESGLVKPELELRAFAKTGTIDPGSSAPVRFTIEPRDLASFDPKRAAWVADAGEYEIRIGGDSSSAAAVLRFKLDKEIVVAKAKNLLQPKVGIRELIPPAK